MQHWSRFSLCSALGPHKSIETIRPYIHLISTQKESSSICAYTTLTCQVLSELKLKVNLYKLPNELIQSEPKREIWTPYKKRKLGTTYTVSKRVILDKYLSAWIFFSNFKEEINTKSRHNRAKVFLKSLLYFHASLRLIHGIKKVRSMIVKDRVVLCTKVSSQVA